MYTKTLSHRKSHRVLVLFGLLACLTLARADGSSDDQTVLQGTWQATAVVDRGTAKYEDEVSTLKLKIKGDHYMYDFGDNSISADFKVDASKTPKEMDVTFLGGRQVGTTMKAIYSVEGDTLRICAGLYARPKDFASTLEAQTILFTFQRDLPSKDITGVEILSYGIFVLSPIADTGSKMTGGTPIAYGTPKLREQTQTIPATLNIEFGMQFVVHGSPSEKKVKLRVVNLYPPRTDETTGQTTTQQSFDIEVGLEDSKDGGVFSRLDKRSDLVPGTWTIQIFDHDKKLLEKTFTLVKP